MVEMAQEQTGCAVIVIHDGLEDLALSSNEDGEHMASWTVGDENDKVSVVNGHSRRNGVTMLTLPQFIQCHIKPSTSRSSSWCKTMKERRASDADADLLERELQQAPSPRDHPAPTRDRTASPDVDDLVGVRLSLAGLQPVNLSRQNSRFSSSCDDELLDELHSDLYSSVIEKLRLELVDCLPCVDEEMVSKAIIYAFSTEPSSKAEHLSNKYQVEVDHLCEAHRWAREHRRCRDEAAEQDFLQSCLNKVFLQIHQEQLSSCNRALRILISVATILGLGIDDSVYVPQDTLLLQGLPRNITRQVLHKRLSCFGEVRAVAISKENSGFAYCRFREESSARQVLANGGSLTFQGTQPRLSMLIGHRDLSRDRFQTPPDSPERAVASLRAPGEEQEELQISPACVSKHVSDSYWKQKQQQQHRRNQSSSSGPALELTSTDGSTFRFFS